MKVVLEYTLPEERDEYKIAMNAGAMLSVIEEIRRYVRSRLKHETPSQEAANDLERIREIICEGELDDR